MPRGRRGQVRNPQMSTKMPKPTNEETPGAPCCFPPGSQGTEPVPGSALNAATGEFPSRCVLHAIFRATFIMLCLSLVVVNCTFSIMGPILPQGVRAHPPIRSAHAAGVGCKPSKKLSHNLGCPAEAESRGVGPTSVGLIFSVYAFVNFAVSPSMGQALQRG